MVVLGVQSIDRELWKNVCNVFLRPSLNLFAKTQCRCVKHVKNKKYEFDRLETNFSSDFERKESENVSPKRGHKGCHRFQMRIENGEPK